MIGVTKMNYCKGCKSEKLRDWTYCPFCGATEEYSLENPPSASQFTSSEETQFNDAIRVVRTVFDNLKRARRRRDQAEGQITAQVKEIQSLRESLTRKVQPESFRIGNINGVKPSNEVRYPLQIRNISYDHPLVNVEVYLP
jgi:hypothetical protein